MNKLLLAVSLAIGAGIGYVDSRPTWDDTGITVAAILISGGILGALGPSRPWLWALVVGSWIPLLGIAIHRNYGSLVAIPIAFAAAYAGMGLRRALTPQEKPKPA